MARRCPQRVTQPGRLPEWPKGSDCKSDGIAYAGSNPAPATRREGRWNASGFPLVRAELARGEHLLSSALSHFFHAVHSQSPPFGLRERRGACGGLQARHGRHRVVLRVPDGVRTRRIPEILHRRARWRTSVAGRRACRCKRAGARIQPEHRALAGSVGMPCDDGVVAAEKPGSRKPPVAVRGLLEDDGFGCPWAGCGNPYLTYHHDDLPWHVQQPHHATPLWRGRRRHPAPIEEVGERMASAVEPVPTRIREVSWP